MKIAAIIGIIFAMMGGSLYLCKTGSDNAIAREKAVEKAFVDSKPAGAKWEVVHRICPQWHNHFVEQKYYASTMVSEGGGSFHFTNAKTGKWVYISGGQITITEL